MMKWRAWYTDSRVYDSDEIAWSELPDSGVLYVVEYRDTGRTLWSGQDWYVMQDGRFSGVSSGEWGSWQDRPTEVCLSCIKKGVGVPDEEFDRVAREALHG